MGTMDGMITGLVDYTCEDLEALERARPELGRVEVVDGALHATGESAVGDLHQLIVQRLHLLLAPLCPPTHILRLDTWWQSPRGKLRADVAIWRPQDRPENRRAFRLPPYAALEVLSDDARHDTVTKDDVYRQFGVRRGHLDPNARWGWWMRLDGVDHDGPTAMWTLDGWPAVVLDRDVLLADQD
jgi:hypothetical protein